MSVSKAEVLSALKRTKVKQDTFNEGKFVQKEDGKGLSHNDFADSDVTKLATIATGAQVNVIESITIDDVSQTITDKGVTLDLSAYAKKSDVATALRYKGSVNTFADLPLTDNEVGDVYNIKTYTTATDIHGTEVKAGDNVAYNGTGWDLLGGTADLSGYFTKAEVNKLFADADEKINDEEIAGIFATE